jgi:hypothetical protein
VARYNKPGNYSVMPYIPGTYDRVLRTSDLVTSAHEEFETNPREIYDSLRITGPKLYM